MIAEQEYLSEARIKLTNADMSLKFGSSLLAATEESDNPIEKNKWNDIRDFVGTNQWNYGLARCIRGLKKELGLPVL